MRGHAEPWIGDDRLNYSIGSTRLHSQSTRRLGTRIVLVAGDLRPGLLRDRDDGRGRLSIRHGALRLRGLPRLAAPGGSDDRRWARLPENGAGAARGLRPDA